MMDFTALAALLAPALPFLVKGGEKLAEMSAEKIGGAAPELIQQVWERLRRAIDNKPAAQDIVLDLATSPDDEDLRVALRGQLKKILQADHELAQQLAGLMQEGGQVTANQAQLDGDGVIAQAAKNAVAATKGAVGVGGNVGGDITVLNIGAAAISSDQLWAQIGKPKPRVDLDRVTARYLQTLLDRYKYLDFRGMGISDRIPLKLPLLQMYVPLKARRETPEGDTWSRELHIAGRKASRQECEAMGERLSEPQPLLELIQKNDGLIILGDPGAGKTTFLKFLTLTLATGQGEVLGLSQRLPVLVPLSAYANALAESDIPLDRFIARYYEERGVELPLGKLLEEALKAGGVLLLLDGLDEVKDLSRRHLVVERVVDFFTFHRRAGNKFLITSRLVGYPEVRPTVDGLAESTLVDLDDEEIESFIEKWTIALEQAAQGATQVAEFDAAQERDELLTSVRHNPGVRTLAANPLLLTILALMKRQGITLPERRVELYQKYVETLLYNWNQARSLAGRESHRLEVRETLRILAPLALWMHRTSPGVGLVKEGELHRELERICRDRGAQDPALEAETFLRGVREHSGLLLDRGGRQYGFIHLTFQEYLAGVALAQMGQQGMEPVVKELAAHLEDDNWHEVSLLCIGFISIIQQRDEAAGAVLEALLKQADNIGEAAILAGEAVNDVGNEGVPPSCRERVSQALLATLRNDRENSAPRRVEAGRVLGAIGDPRVEVTTLEQMEFCQVPPGPFLLGSQADDEDAYEDEQPQQQYDIGYPYWIARYPVTVAQFKVFVGETGFTLGHTDVISESLNQPIRWVSWHEALAFCQWLTESWRAQGWIETDHRVTLPSEVEWEKAARGGIEILEHSLIRPIASLGNTVSLVENDHPSRIYPWGDKADTNRANFRIDIEDTNSVGCYP
ncbi:MAG: SUMF1/EgtB/PvdO family nonheme iron enzyme, partial [Pseudomonadota bacterium]